MKCTRYSETLDGLSLHSITLTREEWLTLKENFRHVINMAESFADLEDIEERSIDEVYKFISNVEKS